MTDYLKQLQELHIASKKNNSTTSTEQKKKGTVKSNLGRPEKEKK